MSILQLLRLCRWLLLRFDRLASNEVVVTQEFIFIMHPAPSLLAQLRKALIAGNGLIGDWHACVGFDILQCR